MGDEWSEVILSQLGEVARGRSRHRPRYAEHLYGGKYPFIQTGDVKASNGRVNSHSQTYSEAGLEQSKLWPRNTMCITIAANIAETGILEYPACFPDSIIGFIADDKKCDIYFVEYMFRFLRRNIQREASGSVQDNINMQTLERLRFRVPSLDVQKAIAHILGTLDDKIELNHQTNQTLEAMAQALFKSWFVDFDPVIDKALVAGNEVPEPLKARAATRQALGDARKPLPEEIRREFPDGFEFVDEMGWVPRGWEILSLSEIIRIKHGYAFKGDYFTNEAGRDVLVTPGNFKPGGGFQLNKYKYYDGPVPDDYVLQQGDIIVTMTDLSKKSDTLGYPAIVPSSAEYRFLHNQRVGLVSEVEECGIGMYIYHVLKSEYCRHTVLGSATGTTVVHTSPKKILAHRTAYSGSGIEAFFDGLVKPYFNLIQELSVESNVLEKLRDTLLPKLLSGQLTIPNAEKLVADAL